MSRSSTVCLICMAMYCFVNASVSTSLSAHSRNVRQGVWTLQLQAEGDVLLVRLSLLRGTWMDERYILEQTGKHCVCVCFISTCNTDFQWQVTELKLALPFN